MSGSQCLGISSAGIYDKFSAKKLLKLVKAVKPVLKLMKKHTTNAVTPSTCNFDIVESFQNDINESELYRLDFKFFDQVETNISEADENLKNEQLEQRLLLEKLCDDTAEKKPLNSTMDKCGCERAGVWTPRADFDIYEREDEYYTCRQTAEQQVSLAVI